MLRALVPLLALLVVPLAAPLAPAADAACPDVRASALAGDVVPSDVSGSCPGIRPGASIGGCTMAWILRAGHTFYGTTAGHCGGVGARVFLPSANQDVGTIIYSVDQPIGEDFAVFRIDAEDVARIDPRMCAWGGVGAVWTGSGGSPVVQHFGHGLVLGTLPTTRAREGVLGYANDAAFTFAGAAAPGDSGSPAMLASGEALGVITDLLAPRAPGTGPLAPSDPALLSGAVLGTRLDHGLAAARAATGLDLELVSAL